MSWQPIATAPTDGTPFLAACREFEWVEDDAGEENEVETTRLVVVRAQKNYYRK